MTSHIPPITEDDIAQFLTNTPGFFERHAEVLASVQITSPHGARAVSLQERQAEMLREKIKGLEQRIMEMVRNSTENAAIANKVHQWTGSLLQVRDPFDLPQGASEDARAFASSLTMPFCGPNLGFEPAAWLANEAGEPAQSLALLPLRAGAIDSATPAFGLLVLGSQDPQRFDATMGTEFLSRMAELASAALLRLK